MFKHTIFFLLMAVSAVSFSQDKSTLPDNRELILKARSLHIGSDTVFMKREQLQSALLGQPDFRSWDLQITERKDLADLLVNVKRIPLTGVFIYTVTDRKTQTIVMSGEVHQIEGFVHASVAREIVEKMKGFRSQQPPPKQS